MSQSAELETQASDRAGRVRRAAPLLWFPVTLFFQEMVVKVWAFGRLLDRGTGFALLFSAALGMACGLLCSLFGEKGNRRASVALEWCFSVWFMVQTVYFTIFRTFLTAYSLGGAGKIHTFWREILSGIGRALLPLLLLALPLAVLLIWGRVFTPKRRAGRRVLAGMALCFGLCQFGGALWAVAATGGAVSPRFLYLEEFIPDLAVSNFGVMTMLRLDLAQRLPEALRPAALLTPVSVEASPVAEPEPLLGEAELPPAEPTPAPVVYAPNVMELDFDALAQGTEDATLREMDAWFARRSPTLQNEYTGRFAGKNLIWFTAEGFSRFAVDAELTPTLYKLANSGFVFENFYNPLWWVSTLDGEYAVCTSLIPKSGVWSMKQSAQNEMYFCLGNQLSRLGYGTRAYHDHTWNYYRRDLSHPNMGYDYKGLGHGLKVKASWPESDLEMMQVTLPEYAGDAPFHTYYMTVSGHLNYTFMGNTMAYKHRNEVGREEHSEGYRAYLACQMELDRALEYLLDYLDEAGILEDTVICLSADHYPYGLEQAVLDEFNGGPLDMRFDVYKSTLILWCGDMEEPVLVSKACSSLDVLPTLSNLFGLEYDSRLLMGRDILSDCPGLVVFSDRSYLTDSGRYDAAADRFSPADGVQVPDGYVGQVFQQVNDLFTYSKLVLEKDYYAHLGLKSAQ